jgi:hypothetical protein
MSRVVVVDSIKNIPLKENKSFRSIIRYRTTENESRHHELENRTFQVNQNRISFKKIPDEEYERLIIY